MTTMEIFMLVGGLAAFVISFFLPDGNTAEPGEGISQEELQQLFDDEVELSRQKIDDMTKETLDYSMEKTERSLEKIANEKIMAVGEYSDTVLDQINQSHNQVVFLSDMLRKSKEELTDLLNRAEQSSKDANVRANEAYDLASNAKKLAEDAAERAEEAGRTAVTAEEKMIDARRLLHGNENTDEPSLEEDAAEAVEVPADVFENLVNEFSLEDGAEENTGKRGAEERLVENLTAFRDALKEDAAEESESSFTPFADLPVHAVDDISEPEDVPEPAADAEESYDGLSEEEKMEALLRAATEELAQDVTSVTGISETRRVPSEEEAEEEMAEEISEEISEETAEAEPEDLPASEVEDANAEIAMLLGNLTGAELPEELPAEESAKAAEETKADPQTAEEPAVDDASAEQALQEMHEESAAPAAKKSSRRKGSTKKASGTGTRRKNSTKAGEQMSIPAELLRQEEVSLQFSPGEENAKNNNARILEMHRMGRSDMAIAKELGMGIGEVKLIIALNEIS